MAFSDPQCHDSFSIYLANRVANGQISLYTPSSCSRCIKLSRLTQKRCFLGLNVRVSSVVVCRLREDDATQLSVRTRETGLRQHPSQQRTAQQTMEEENMLRAATGHLLPRPHTQTDARGESHVLDCTHHVIRILGGDPKVKARGRVGARLFRVSHWCCLLQI
jgi:hypothetical protein